MFQEKFLVDCMGNSLEKAARVNHTSKGISVEASFRGLFLESAAQSKIDPDNLIPGPTDKE